MISRRQGVPSRHDMPIARGLLVRYLALDQVDEGAGHVARRDENALVSLGGRVAGQIVKEIDHVRPMAASQVSRPMSA